MKELVVLPQISIIIENRGKVSLPLKSATECPDKAICPTNGYMYCPTTDYRDCPLRELLKPERDDGSSGTRG